MAERKRCIGCSHVIGVVRNASEDPDVCNQCAMAGFVKGVKPVEHVGEPVPGKIPLTQVKRKKKATDPAYGDG